MARWKVTLYERTSRSYEVTADSKDEAILNTKSGDYDDFLAEDTIDAGTPDVEELPDLPVEKVYDVFVKEDREMVYRVSARDEEEAKRKVLDLEYYSTESSEIKESDIQQVTEVP